MTVSTKALSKNARTIQSYEEYAEKYDAIVSDAPSPEVKTTLRALADRAGAGASVLEIGSGSGRDADFVESLGLVVRRTDATRAFLDLQAARGKHAELLNVLTDDLGGPYDAIMALAVLIHIDRSSTETVLRKIAEALRPNGLFLVSVREGEGETGGNYQTVYWQRDAFVAALAAASLNVEWDQRSAGRDEDVWWTFLARSVR
jgi:2-polyprenyl-3-methyl-5-hydroxy-6-metoxy-1,4-benzoquinol methylase